MIEIKDIEKLAGLARLELKEDEKEKLKKDLDSILAYVSELSKAPKAETGKSGEEGYLKNVMRADDDNFASGEFTEDILADAPNRADNYFKVKKIFN